MYSWLKRVVLAVLKVPAEPPEAPAGTHETAQVFRASPHYLSYLMFQYAVGMAVAAGGAILGAVVAGVVLWSRGLSWVGLVVEVVAAAIILGKLAVFYVTTRLNYEMRWYIVTDRSLRIREGVFHVREVTLTFANVQNLNIVQGPLQRYFGISDLIVETAGGGSGGGHGAEGMMPAHHGVLRGVENAGELKERIQALLRAYRASGLGDPEERAAAGARASGGGLPAEVVEALAAVRAEAGLLRKSLGA